MSPLPIFFGELLPSIEAAMIFPYHAERAKAYAAWRIMRGIATMREKDFSDFIDPLKDPLIEVACVASGFAYIYGDALRNGKEGQRAGIIVACLWAMICNSRETASWEGAIQAAERYTARRNKDLPASRSPFRDCLSRFKPVLHLLGARTLRRRPGQTINGSGAMIDLSPDYSVGYLRSTDVLFFATEARQLQVGLLAWNKTRSQPSNLLDEMFELNGPAWTPPARQPGWPDTGQIKRVALDPWIKIVRGRPGRPRKTLS